MKKILVVGDLIVDLYITGENYRISDEAPVPIVKVDEWVTNLGGAANVANNIKHMGEDPILCGAIGFVDFDKSSSRFLKAMDAQNLSTTSVAIGKMNTTVKSRVIIKDQQVVRFDTEDTELSPQIIEEIIKKLEEINYDEIGLIVVSDYKKGVICVEVMDLLKSKNIDIIVDPKPGNEILYQGTYCMTPNLREFNQFTHSNFNKDNLDGIETVANDYRDIMCLDYLIVTLGEKGALCCSKDECKIMSNHEVEVTNTIGAGDTFLSALCHATISGEDMFDATVIANIGAAIAVSKKYTSVCSIDEIDEYLNKEKSTNE